MTITQQEMQDIAPVHAAALFMPFNPERSKMQNIFCLWCQSEITQSPVDGAWEDSSGACGCGDGEHTPDNAHTPFLKAVADSWWSS